MTHQSIPPRQKATTLYSTPLRLNDVSPRGDLLPPKNKTKTKGICTKVDPLRLYVQSVLGHFGARLGGSATHTRCPSRPRKGRGTETVDWRL